MAETSKRAASVRNQRIILIVEDDELLRTVLRFEFEKNGFDVREAENGRAGLASIVEIHPDVIITDIEMPVMNGLSFIDAVRKINVKAGIPIIAISASKGEGVRERAVAAGANQFCEKPLTANGLLAIVNRHLSVSNPV